MAKGPTVVVTLRVPWNIRDSQTNGGKDQGKTPHVMYSMKNRLLLCGFALTLLSASAIAHEFKPLEGEYAIGSKTILDPPPGEKKDRLFLYLHGKAAEDTFNAMPQRVSTKVCGEDQVMKQAGGLQCLRTRENLYYCSVGILLDNGRTVTGSVC